MSLPLHASVVDVLSGWTAPDRSQDALRHAFLGLLAARPDAVLRSCEPGHVTASTVVLSADHRFVLLTLHPRVGRWVQLGGHCERDDDTIVGAGLREATEESGIVGLSIDPVPVHLDVHPITCSLGRPTRHFDIRFRVVAPDGAVPAISAESDDLRFWPVGALPLDCDDGVRAAVSAAMGLSAVTDRSASSIGHGNDAGRASRFPDRRSSGTRSWVKVQSQSVIDLDHERRRQPTEGGAETFHHH